MFPVNWKFHGEERKEPNNRKGIFLPEEDREKTGKINAN